LLLFEFGIAAAEGIKSEIVEVAYELQKGGNQMIKFWH
jgi:hypothetical protein